MAFLNSEGVLKKLKIYFAQRLERVVQPNIMQKTIQNLAKAFIGESQARNRYTFYAKEAIKEGYEKVSEVFLLTAEQEKEHASWLMKMINELKKTSEENLDEIKVASAPMPTIFGDTITNLKAAIAGEDYEFTSMYPEFADIADEEGLPEIANRLRSIAKAEGHHEERYSKLLKQIEGGTMFNKDYEVEWVCRKCGYMHKGMEPVEKCPSCGHDRNFFELKCEEY